MGWTLSDTDSYTGPYRGGAKLRLILEWKEVSIQLEKEKKKKKKTVYYRDAKASLTQPITTYSKPKPSRSPDGRRVWSLERRRALRIRREKKPFGNLISRSGRGSSHRRNPRLSEPPTLTLTLSLPQRLCYQGMPHLDDANPEGLQTVDA